MWSNHFKPQGRTRKIAGVPEVPWRRLLQRQLTKNLLWFSLVVFSFTSDQWCVYGGDRNQRLFNFITWLYTQHDWAFLNWWEKNYWRPRSLLGFKAPFRTKTFVYKLIFWAVPDYYLFLLVAWMKFWFFWSLLQNAHKKKCPLYKQQ